MVFCYECDTLHDDLTRLGRPGPPVNHSDPTGPACHCPGCGRPFEYFFVRDRLYKVPLARWVGSGFGHLLAKGVAAEPIGAPDRGGGK
jgi:hypothetical protein